MRQDPKIRKVNLLTVALELARIHGYNQITRALVANRANVSNSLVTHHFGTMGQLRRAVMRWAVANSDLQLIAQGLALRDAQALKASEELRQKAASTIAG